MKFLFHTQKFSTLVRFFRNVQTQAIKNLKSGFAEVASNLGVQPSTLKGPALEKVQPSKNSSPKGVSKRAVRERTHECCLPLKISWPMCLQRMAC